MPFDHPRAREIDKLERGLVHRRHQIRKEVAERKAHTPEGLQAQARTVLADLEDDADPDFANYDQRVINAVSLARDIVGRAAG
jgi:hypothetical protein